MIRNIGRITAVIVASVSSLLCIAVHGASYYTGPSQGSLHQNWSNISVPSSCQIVSYAYAHSGETWSDYPPYYQIQGSNAQVRVFNQNTGTVQEVSVYTYSWGNNYNYDTRSTSQPAGTYQVLHYGDGSTLSGGYAAMETHILW